MAELPPNGRLVRDTRDQKLVAFSALVDGHRADYVDSPAYRYADRRGRPTRFAKALCDGPMLAHQRPGGDVEKHGLFMHPPYVHGVGYAFALFDPVDLPASPTARFRCLIGKRDGSDPGDGILFRVAVVEPDGTQTIVAEKQWIQHAWTPLEADLSRWASKRVRIKLLSDVGPKDNSSGDWACWSAMRIESAFPVLATTLHDQPLPSPKP